MYTSGLVTVNFTHGTYVYLSSLDLFHFPPSPLLYYLPVHFLPNVSFLQLIVFPFIPKYIGFRKTFFITVLIFGATSALLPVSNLITGPMEAPTTNCSTNAADPCIRDFNTDDTMLSTNSTDLGGNLTNTTWLAGNGTENSTTPFCGQVYQMENIHDDSIARIIPTVWLVLGLILMGNTVARCGQCVRVARGVTARGCELCPLNCSTTPTSVRVHTMHPEYVGTCCKLHCIGLQLCMRPVPLHMQQAIWYSVV